MHVLIVGGGIGGLALAAGLHKRNIAFTLVERANALREVGAGISLWPNATRALEQLGLRDTLAAVRNAVPAGAQGSIFDHRGRPLSTMDPKQIAERFGSTMAVLHRARLIEALAREVPTGRLCLGAGVAAVRSEDAGATVELEDGRTLRGDVVIAADGIWSRARAYVAPEAEPRYTGVSSWRGIAKQKDMGFSLADGVWGMYLGDGREVGVLPLADGEVYWFASHLGPQGQAAGALAGRPEGTHRDDVLHALARWPKAVRAAVESTPADAVLRTDLFDLPPLSRWVSGRVALLGDAAHATSPHLGMGAAMALEDAAWLCGSLQASAGVDAWLAAYPKARRARCERVIQESRTMGRFLHLRNGVLVALRNAALRFMPVETRMRQLAWLLADTPAANPRSLNASA